MEASVRVAIVEDESLFRDLLRTGLSAVPRIEVVADYGDADSASAGIPTAGVDVVLMDINLGAGRNGVQLGLELREIIPTLGIVLLSNHRDINHLHAIPKKFAAGWSYLLKRSVSDLASLQRAIEGAAKGLFVLDPELVADLGNRLGVVDSLPPRGKEILQLLAEGLSNGEIARRLHLAEKYVENQVSELYQRHAVDTKDPTAHPRVRAALLFLGHQG